MTLCGIEKRQPDCVAAKASEQIILHSADLRLRHGPMDVLLSAFTSPMLEEVINIWVAEPTLLMGVVNDLW